PRELLQRVWPPMLATLAPASSASPEHHVFEVKYDGYRGIAAVSGGRVSFLTRNAIDLGTRFPAIYRALGRLPVPEVVLDGEVVAFDPRGASRFELLMEPNVDHRYIAFDILWLDGEDVRSRPLEERRDLLESVLSNVPPPIMLAERIPGDVNEALETARRRGLEGILAKERGSPYVGGRAREWLKIKVAQTQEVAIIGFTPISTGGKDIGALLVGVHDGIEFRFAGKVGTGFTAKLRKQLRAMLEKDVVDKSAAPDAPRMREAIWVKPRYVAQVRFTEWTRDGRLRHPSFQGLREDKKPEETRREIPQEVRQTSAAGTKKARATSRRPSAAAARSAPEPDAERERRRDDAGRSPEIEVKLTSGDRVVFPNAQITKGDVFAYYRDIAEVMVPALAGRPLSLKQWPKGITGEGFYRQNVPTLPSWATSVEVKTERRPVRHPIVDRRETLLWLANQSAFELHMWHSRVPHLSEPDWVAFDLDPGSGPFDDLITVARALHGLLANLGLESVPKTSGKRGLHVLVPVARGHHYGDTFGFAVAITEALATALPEIATTERTIAKRGGRLYVDALQNGQGKTIIAPYSLRGVEGAPVSTPLRWSEVTPSLEPARFNLKTIRARVDEVGDLFAPALAARQRLPRFAP
ncbi:MAG TPA: DNA ligase D, partial [Myxococcaceae bacterium]|nr:DNA ligase D [Myxococcaceae bacterium]